MPSEAQPFMDSELDDGRAGAAAAAASATTPPANNSSSGQGGTTRATAITAVSVGSEGKPSWEGSGSCSGENNTLVEKLPLSSVNATSCLSRSLAAQRGWALGDEDTRKQLIRAFYAAAPDSQKARRVAARLFCLTGYVLSAVAPGDARVLCEAAGDSLDWGLDETEPRLVNQPIRRETKEQRRRLVLRIKVRGKAWFI